MRNVANYITFSRIAMSIMLFFTETFSIPFYVIYAYCGLSDILDGFVARKSKNETKAGALLDSISDAVFIAVTMVKILPTLGLTNGVIMWVALIAIIRIINALYGYIHHRKIVLLHTPLNKITGFMLFITPFAIINIDSIIIEVILCIIATVATVQESYLIRTKDYTLLSRKYLLSSS